MIMMVERIVVRVVQIAIAPIGAAVKRERDVGRPRGRVARRSAALHEPEGARAPETVARGEALGVRVRQPRAQAQLAHRGVPRRDPIRGPRQQRAAEPLAAPVPAHPEAQHREVTRATRQDDPIALMAAALDEGASLILFPEGTRNTTEEQLLPFKTGLYHLAGARPQVELVPVWIEYLNRVMPKGELGPIPLLCTVTFGAPLRLQDGEGKAAFLERTRAALLSLAPVRESGR